MTPPKKLTPTTDPHTVHAVMLAKAKTSCLTPSDVKLLHLTPYPENHGLPIQPQYAGFKIPYFTPDGKVDPEFYRFRFTQDRPSTGVAALAQPTKPRRYSQPEGSSCGVYMPPLLSQSWASIQKDASIGITVTEGELKAACGCRMGVATLGLGGVYNWRSAKEHQELLPALEAFEWKERTVNLCFDSDIVSNPMVRVAAGRLAAVLALRGAKVYYTTLPAAVDGSKQGLDDYAYRNGKSALIDLFSTGLPLGAGVALHEMNAQAALIRSTGEVVELETGAVYSATMFTDVVYKNAVYTDFSTTKAVDGKVTTAAKTKFTAKEWLAWPLRNEVTRVEYEPGDDQLITASNGYNSWRPQGWGCTPSPHGAITPWETLLQRVCAGLSPERIQWVRQWFAYPLQNPGAKLSTALLFWGRATGTGKTWLGETMSYLYGDNYGTVNNEQISSQFNEYLMNKQFIVGDEISLGDKRHTASGLKDMITRPVVRINSKNRKTFVVRDCANYYFTSNSPDALYLEAGDRRVFVHHVESDTLAKPEYMAYRKWLREDGGPARLFHYMLNEVDCSDFDPFGRAPLTQAKVEMVSVGRGDTEDWAVMLATDPDSVITQPYDLFTTRDLLQLYDPDSHSQTKIIGMGKALSAAGIFKVPGGNNAKVLGVRTRIWAVRNTSRYRLMGPAAASKCYEEERLKLAPGGVGSNRKFAGRVQ